MSDAGCGDPPDLGALIPCAWCGSPLNVDYVDVTALGGGTFETTRGRSQCSNPRCAPRCPTCKREVGDIHGPECGAIIAGKLGDVAPCTISRADCGSQWPEERTP